jgi:hypothetical protein
MARQRIIHLKIIQGETYSFAFPPLTDRLAGAIAGPIVEVGVGANHIKFGGDHRAVLTPGAIPFPIQIENNGDPNSNIKLDLVADPEFSGGITTANIAGDTIPANMQANGRARRLYDLPIDLTDDHVPARAEIRDTGGSLACEFDVAGDTLGIYTISLTAAASAAIPTGRYHYDIRREIADVTEVEFPYAGEIIVVVPVTEP